MIRRLIGVGLILISVGCSSAKDRDTALSETVKAFGAQFKKSLRSIRDRFLHGLPLIRQIYLCCSLKFQKFSLRAL